MDLDGDGDADVLSASSNDDKIAWYENDGSGNFGAQQVITTSANGARSVYAMDLDGDGDADVLSASEADDKIAWYENDCASVATCTDGIQNGDETGVDCGGSNCPPCAPDFTDYCQLGLDIDGEGADDQSGESVSLSSDGSVLAIGAPGNNDNGSLLGHVRVYEWDGTGWSQRGVDIDGEAFGDGSGISVSLSSDGSVLAIGADLNDDNGSNSGHVRVYEWDETAWSQRGGDIDGEGADDQSGESVSLSSDGSVLAIGAADNDGNGDSSGHVRVYEWTGTVWSQRGGDIDGESAGDLSGCSVSLSSDGSVLAIGAVANDDYSGHVRVYEWDGTDWSQQGADIDGEAFGGGFGISVSLSSDGSVLAIGAPGDNGNGSNSGSVRVYEWDGTGWFQRGGDIDGASAGDGSGSAVSLSSDGSVLAIGAPNNDDNGDY
ncbi:hypothetical protein IX84_19245, partial [Phaeodactylibacter xiamenensis]